MKTCLFCLLRFYLRVDNTLIRVIDTRIYHEVCKEYHYENQLRTKFSFLAPVLNFKAGADHMIREYTEREDKMADITVPPAIWKDQNEIVNHLTLRKETVERLKFGS